MCLLIKAEMEHCLPNRQTLFTSFVCKEEEGRKGGRERQRKRHV